MKDQLLKGTLILTLATIISKVIGFIYVIPFTALVGTQGNILFEYAYKPYAIMLSLSTMGIPLAISKFVSKYEEKNQRSSTQKLFKASLLIMSASGLFSFLLLYGFAPHIAGIVTNHTDVSGNSLHDVTRVIQLVSFALLIIAPMSVIRGYFQGLGDMKPTAISQVIEQIVRIGFILIMCIIVLKWKQGNIQDAVGWATFAAFIGGLASFAYLIWVYIQFQKTNKTETNTSTTLRYRAIFAEIIKDAIPFALVSLAIPLYQLIETFTINSSLISIGYTQLEAETQNSLISLSQKLVLIPVSLATAFGVTLIPAISKNISSKNKKQTQEDIKKTFRTLFWMVLPLIVIMMILAKPIFGAMFGTINEQAGGALLRYYAPTILLYSLYITSAAIMQGMNYHGYAIVSLGIGVLLKFSTNGWFLQQFEAPGTIFTTDIGFIVSIAINIWVISKATGVSFSYYFKVDRKLGVNILLFGVVTAIGLIISLQLEQWLEISASLRPWFICIISGALPLLGYGYQIMGLKK